MLYLVQLLNTLLLCMYSSKCNLNTMFINVFTNLMTTYHVIFTFVVDKDPYKYFQNPYTRD